MTKLAAPLAMALGAAYAQQELPAFEVSIRTIEQAPEEFCIVAAEADDLAGWYSYGEPVANSFNSDEAFVAQMSDRVTVVAVSDGTDKAAGLVIDAAADGTPGFFTVECESEAWVGGEVPLLVQDDPDDVATFDADTGLLTLEFGWEGSETDGVLFAPTDDIISCYAVSSFQLGNTIGLVDGVDYIESNRVHNTATIEIRPQCANPPTAEPTSPPETTTAPETTTEMTTEVTMEPTSPPPEECGRRLAKCPKSKRGKKKHGKKERSHRLLSGGDKDKTRTWTWPEMKTRKPKQPQCVAGDAEREVAVQCCRTVDPPSPEPVLLGEHSGEHSGEESGEPESTEERTWTGRSKHTKTEATTAETSEGTTLPTTLPEPEETVSNTGNTDVASTDAPTVAAAETECVTSETFVEEGEECNKKTWPWWAAGLTQLLGGDKDKPDRCVSEKCFATYATLAEAEDFCANLITDPNTPEGESEGWRLCSVDEIEEGACCADACRSKHDKIWTSDECDCESPEEPSEETPSEETPETETDVPGETPEAST